MVGDATQSEEVLKKLATQKLLYVLNKRRRE